jgi:hypothetical protein
MSARLYWAEIFTLAQVSHGQVMQVIVDGMRVRVRLDQQRIASLLQGISPQAMGSQFADVASGVLSMLGDMASLSFAGYHPGQWPSLWLYKL